MENLGLLRQFIKPTSICWIIIIYSNIKHNDYGCKAVKPASLTEEKLGPQN